MINRITKVIASPVITTNIETKLTSPAVDLVLVKITTKIAIHKIVIKLINKLDYYATGVLILKMLDSDGEVIDHASYKAVMKAGSENSIRISALADEIIHGIEVVALDSYNGNMMSDSEAKVFIN